MNAVYIIPKRFTDRLPVEYRVTTHKVDMRTKFCDVYNEKRFDCRDVNMILNKLTDLGAYEKLDEYGKKLVMPDAETARKCLHILQYYGWKL